MSTNQAQRPQYFENQYLGADDLTAAVEYARLQQARHALGAHTWGIASGLHLTEKESSSGGGIDLFIQPGFAWDGYGRPVVVLAPYKLSTEKFKSFTYDAGTDAGNPEGRLVEVWLRYVELPTRAAAPGFEGCGSTGNFSRVDELFQVEVGERKLLKDRRDPLTVAGRRVDARDVLQTFDAAAPPLYDDSVAYQTFPAAGARARWLIPVGYVRWMPEQGGQPGRFVARDAEDLKKSRSQRRYAGVVGESVAAADGVIRLRDRAKDYSAHQSADLVWVEGDLRVEGHARLFGGELRLLDQSGQNHGSPLTVRRLENNDANGRSLQAQIGAAQAGANRFEVGPVIGNALRPRLAVLDSGLVGIGTTAPNRLLTIQGAAHAYLNVKTGAGAQEVLLGADGGGGIVSTMTNHDLQLRAGGNQTKVTVKADGRVGVGTSTPNRLLTLRGEAGTYLNVQSDDGEHEVLLGADGNGGIVSTMTNHDLQLRSGVNVTHVTIKANGNVGVGTTTPNARLDVNGRIVRGGHDFSFAGVAAHLGLVVAQWGTVSDWNILVSPRIMGQEGGFSEGDNALLMIRCYALPNFNDGNTWQVFAEYKFRTSEGPSGDWQPGFANWLLVPR